MQMNWSESVLPFSKSNAVKMRLICVGQLHSNASVRYSRFFTHEFSATGPASAIGLSLFVFQRMFHLLYSPYFRLSVFIVRSRARACSWSVWKTSNATIIVRITLERFTLWFFSFCKAMWSKRRVSSRNASRIVCQSWALIDWNF